MATEGPYFRTLVCPHITRKPKNLPSNRDTYILFLHYKVIGNRWPEGPSIVYEPVELVCARKLAVLLSDIKRFSRRPTYTEYTARVLSSMGLAEDRHQAVIQQLFEAVEEVHTDKHVIHVRVLESTVRFLDVASNLPPGILDHFLLSVPLPVPDNQMIISTGSREDFECNLVRATRSCIDRLEKVRLDSLETSTTQMPCAICLEKLDHFAVQEGADHQQMIITRLPCLHLYHGDCIVRWLERNHMCPLCRCPTRTFEKPSRSRHWDILVMAAGGILATFVGALVSRDTKRN